MKISNAAIQRQLTRARARLAALPSWKRLMLQRANETEVAMGVIPEPDLTVSSFAAKTMAAMTSPEIEDDYRYAAALKFAKRIERHTEKPLPEGSAIRRAYTLTTIASAERYGGTRTVAIFDEFVVAETHVLGNWGDLFECSYEFAVIEALALNELYAGLDLDRAQYWYAWQGEAQDGSYVPIEKPEQFADLGEFAVG